MASIRTAGLTKDFGDLRAVNEIDLDLPEGGVAGFVGSNGAVQQRHQSGCCS
jgi:ABC-2 type transport system ATP-binding protein